MLGYYTKEVIDVSQTIMQEKITEEVYRCKTNNSARLGQVIVQKKLQVYHKQQCKILKINNNNWCCSEDATNKISQPSNTVKTRRKEKVVKI